MTAANRGKASEAKVAAHLKAIEASHLWFTHNRVQDAHAAGGRFTPTAGDFQAFGFYKSELGMYSRNFLIEVKEMKHDFRLPGTSYSADKVARVMKRVHAGSEAIVLLYHSEAKIWRAVPITVFADRSKPSWDLRDWPAVDYRTALNEFLGFCP